MAYVVGGMVSNGVCSGGCRILETVVPSAQFSRGHAHFQLSALRGNPIPRMRETRSAQWAKLAHVAVGEAQRENAALRSFWDLLRAPLLPGCWVLTQ